MGTESLIEEGISIDKYGNLHRVGDVDYDPTSPANLGSVNRNFGDIKEMSDRGISKDLATMVFPDEIKSKADEIFRASIVPTKRKKSRKLLIFYCLLLAYKELGKIEIPEIISSRVGIKGKHMSKSLRMDEFFPQYNLSEIKYKPQQFIKRVIEVICSNYNISICERDVMELAERILEIDPTLYEKIPQNVAIGIVMYYMRTRGMGISDVKLSELFCKSKTTLESLYEDCAKADNRII